MRCWLRRETRNALCALYAFMRLMDESVGRGLEISKSKAPGPGALGAAQDEAVEE